MCLNITQIICLQVVTLKNFACINLAKIHSISKSHKGQYYGSIRQVTKPLYYCGIDEGKKIALTIIILITHF